jgi:hypothetical protein
MLRTANRRDSTQDQTRSDTTESHLFRYTPALGSGEGDGMRAHLARVSPCGAALAIVLATSVANAIQIELSNPRHYAGSILSESPYGQDWSTTLGLDEVIDAAGDVATSLETPFSRASSSIDGFTLRASAFVSGPDVYLEHRNLESAGAHGGAIFLADLDIADSSPETGA